jgi:hypothetical protein
MAKEGVLAGIDQLELLRTDLRDEMRQAVRKRLSLTGSITISPGWLATSVTRRSS